MEKKEKKEETKENFEGFNEEQSKTIRENFRLKKWWNNIGVVAISGFITGFVGAKGWDTMSTSAPITPTTPAPEM
jgi:hypothetical protein